MLIKKADDKRQQLAELERRMAAGGSNAKADFHKLRAGVKNEQDAAYLIDFDYGETNQNWAVIHDLRLEHKGRVAQIDHLLINRFLDVYVLESKHFNSGICIKETGEFEQWNDWKKAYQGMPSPIEQNERHIKVLTDVMQAVALPTRLGLRIEPRFFSYVLVGASARIKRPGNLDTSQVIKADQLKAKISKEFDDRGVLGVFASAAKMVGSETIRQIAESLKKRHKPLPAPQPPVEPVIVAPATVAPSIVSEPEQPEPSLPTAAMQPTCKGCGGHEGNIEYGKYGYYFKCGKCNENTNQKQICKPGHAPKLRKEKHHFYRECPQCGTSELYFTNPTT